MNYKEIEPEYLDFIKKQKYGTPIAFAKTSLKQEWEAYFAGHEKLQAYCVFGGVRLIKKFTLYCMYCNTP